MKRTVLGALGALAFATLAAGATMNASAQTRGYYVERNAGPPVYAYQSREYDPHENRCDAPRWDPNHRYMPGETVRRKGEVYIATETSRHVYNVNSPPEWTPNYWAPARCH
jgi:hypothetical protein